jgi:Fe/S biogenesis protein NfuA
MLTFTDRAREMVLSFMDQNGADEQALRIHMAPGSPLAPRFELTLVGKQDLGPEDLPVDLDGLTVLVRKDSAPRLEGATVDFVERLTESGFEIRTVPGAGGEPAGPTGDIADRVRTVLDEQVNPGVAAHGGAINLIDVQGTEIYLEMTGGCQGCAMSKLTLRQGVERMIREAVPEVTEIHDSTDHASGSSPFFTGA